MSNITPEKYRRRITMPVDSKLMTEQSHKDECDINFILQRYQKTGILNHINQAAPLYGDFTQCDDLQTALHKVNTASEIFESVPAHIRTQFDNNPINYMEFMINPNNLDQIESLGLPTDHLRPRQQVPATPVAAPPVESPTTPE